MYGSTPKIAPLPFELTFAYEKLTNGMMTQSHVNVNKKYNYFKIGREIKEKPADAVKTTRSILQSSLQIQDQQHETSRLKEYLMMEQQKLDMVQFDLERTKEDFKARCMADDRETKDLIGEVKNNSKYRRALSREKNDLFLKLQHTEDSIKKVNEELGQKKQLKHFLDVLSIQAGIKTYNPFNKPGQLRQSTEYDNSSMENRETPNAKNTKMFKKAIFMTQNEGKDLSNQFKNLAK